MGDYQLLREQEVRGSVAVMALWVLFFLSALALAINAYVIPQINLSAKIKNRAEIFYLANAGVEKAMAFIANDKTPQYDALMEFGLNDEKEFKEVKLGDGFFSVVSHSGDDSEIRYGLTDEESKININRAPYDVLRRFFEGTVGLLPLQADTVAASILDWREPGDLPRLNGAKNNYYQMQNPEYNCKNGNFEVLEELLLVKGMDEDIFNQVKDKLTVYGEGAININTAQKFALLSLGFSDRVSDKIIAFRNGDDGLAGTSDDNYFSTVDQIPVILYTSQKLTRDDLVQVINIIGQGLICVRSNNFRGSSIGKIKTSADTLQVDFVFDRKKQIKSWREEWK